MAKVRHVPQQGANTSKLVYKKRRVYHLQFGSRKLRALDGCCSKCGALVELRRQRVVVIVLDVVTGLTIIPHGGPDMNVAIEAYRCNIKEDLKASCGRLMGTRVDWLIYQLKDIIINCYKYQNFKKEYEFVRNKNKRALALSAIVQAPN